MIKRPGTYSTDNKNRSRFLAAPVFVVRGLDVN